MWRDSRRLTRSRAEDLGPESVSAALHSCLSSGLTSRSKHIVSWVEKLLAPVVAQRYCERLVVGKRYKFLAGGVHATELKGRGAGKTVTVLPLRPTVCGLPTALSLFVSVPVRRPLVLKVTEMLQFFPVARVALQLLVFTKSPVAGPSEQMPFST